MKLDKNILKIAHPFLSKCKKTSVPVTENIAVISGKATISNFDVELIFPLDAPDGLYNLLNGELFTTELKVEDFPLSMLTDKSPTGDGIVLSPGEISPADVANLAACTGKDDLRPVMSAIYFDDENITASDAHVLRMIPIPEGTEKTHGLNLLVPMPQVLVTALKDADYPVKISRYKNPDPKHTNTAVSVQFRDYTINLREVEGRYPNYKSIIPHASQFNHLVKISTAQIAEYIKFAKSMKHPSGLLRIKEGTKPSISDTDQGIQKDFPELQTVDRPYENPDGLIMPMMIIPGSEESLTTNEFGLSVYNMGKFTTGLKGHLIIGLETGNRALLAWLVPERQNTKPRQAPAKSAPQAPEKSPNPAPKNIPAQKPVPQQHSGNGYVKRVIWTNAA